MDFSTPVKQLYHGFMNLANCLFRTQVLEPVNELISPFMKCKLTDFLLLQFLKLPKKREVVCFSWTFCGLWVSSWPAFHTNTIWQDFEIKRKCLKYFLPRNSTTLFCFLCWQLLLNTTYRCYANVKMTAPAQIMPCLHFFFHL